MYPSGRIAHRLREPADGASCALDLADTGPNTLQAVATAVGVTRERIRQIERQGLAKLLPVIGHSHHD